MSVLLPYHLKKCCAVCVCVCAVRPYTDGGLSEWGERVERERESLVGCSLIIIILITLLYYTPDSLETYVGLSYDEQVDPSKHAKHEGTII